MSVCLVCLIQSRSVHAGYYFMIICWVVFQITRSLFFRKPSSISDSEHYLTNANPQMIMKTDILDYKNCTCIMISKKVQTFIFNPLLLFSRFRFAHKAMRKKKKKKKKKNHNFEYSVIQDFVWYSIFWKLRWDTCDS